MASVSYDLIGKTYASYRNPDPRIAAYVDAELSDANTILNIGAGTGSYESDTKYIVAVDPSWLMISRRKPGSSSIQAKAENLPFKDCAFDAVMAILTIHHWNDIALGLYEALRVVRKRIILLTWVGFPDGFWLTEYFPEIEKIDKKLFPPLSWFKKIFGPIRIRTLPIPNNCTDGFLCAYWARPEQYFNEGVRSAISTFNRIENHAVGLNNLKNDLQSGYWEKKYGRLRFESNMDYGYRLIVIDKSVYNNSLKRTANGAVP